MPAISPGGVLWFRDAIGCGWRRECRSTRSRAGSTRWLPPRQHPRREAVVHPALDAGGPSQIDTFDLEARPRQRRTVQGDRDLRPRHPDQRASAQARQAHASSGDRPLDEHQGRRPRAGHVLCSAPAICRRGRSAIRPSVARAKELEPRRAELPSFVSIAPFRSFSPARSAPASSGPHYAPLVVGEQGLSAAQQQRHDAIGPPEGRGSRPPPASTGGRPTRGSSCWTSWTSDFIAQHPAVPVAEPPVPPTTGPSA